MPELKPWPLKNQLTDVLLKDNRINPNAENNCGPTSVAMVLEYLTGVDLPADLIKTMLYGLDFKGYTFMNDLSKFLRDRGGTESEIHTGDANTLLQPIVRQSIDNGYPVIVLYFWDINQPQSGHFAPVVAYDDTGCTRANPWGGVMEHWNWDKFEAWQKLGNCIVIKRKRDPYLDGQARDFVDNPLVEGLNQLREEYPGYFERGG